jgi:hypothetical protein
MADYYRTQIADLRAALTEDGRHRQAAEIVRKLVDRIELNPVVRNGRKTLSVSLYGRLAGILAMATKAKAPLDESGAPIRVTKLVAGWIWPRPTSHSGHDWASEKSRKSGSVRGAARRAAINPAHQARTVEEADWMAAPHGVTTPDQADPPLNDGHSLGRMLLHRVARGQSA